MLGLPSQLEWCKEDQESENSGVKTGEEPQRDEAEVKSEPKYKDDSKNASLVELSCLPKPFLMDFDGNLLEYDMFISNCDFVADAAEYRISDYANLNRLFDVVKEKAKKIILRFAMRNPTTGYKNAKEFHNKRFGDVYVICEAFINQLTSWQMLI